ncbi:MAG: carboxymuconolactone decarboxylase family protein, partial [Bacteroidetes bacterium]|nr:carboxymuconolactone decarboxylase family protein [Bacteroidota bacterium]
MSKPPKRFRQFLADHPQVGSAYERLSAATMEEGPLDGKTAQLI